MVIIMKLSRIEELTSIANKKIGIILKMGYIVSRKSKPTNSKDREASRPQGSGPTTISLISLTL